MAIIKLKAPPSVNQSPGNMASIEPPTPSPEQLAAVASYKERAYAGETEVESPSVSLDAVASVSHLPDREACHALKNPYHKMRLLYNLSNRDGNFITANLITAQLLLVDSLFEKVATLSRQVEALSKAAAANATKAE